MDSVMEFLASDIVSFSLAVIVGISLLGLAIFIFRGKDRNISRERREKAVRIANGFFLVNIIADILLISILTCLN